MFLSPFFVEVLQHNRVDVVFDCEGIRINRARAASVMRRGGTLVSIFRTEPNQVSRGWADLWHFAKEASMYAITYGIWTKYRSRFAF
jgi:NADPH:quinone reductase-like Zn-dependent oxidoreductase